MRIKFVLSALIAVGVLAFGIGAAAAADDAHTLKVRLSWVTSGYQAPFYLAAQKGWFKKAGLDVSLEPGTGSVTTIQLVNSGQYDAGEANLSNAIIARQQGMSIMAIAQLFRTGDICLAVAKDTGINTVADLKGKKIIFTAGSFETPYLDSFLAAGGLKRDQVDLINVDPNTRNAFYADKKADGMFSSPVGSFIILNQIRPSKFILFADYGLNLPSFGIVTSAAAMKAKHDALRTFASTVAGTWTYILAGHEEEAIDAIMKQRPNDRLDRAQIAEQVRDSVPFLYSKATKGWPIGVASEDDWKQSLAVMAKAGAIKPGTKPSEYYTNAYLDPALIKKVAAGS